MRSDWYSVTDRAAREIRRIIDERHAAPGDRIPGQRALAETLGVSRPAVREALARLETLGLVEVRPGAGVFLKAPRGDSAVDFGTAWHFAETSSPQDIYQLRFAIEGFAVRMAARRAAAADIDRLREINDAMERHLRADDKASAVKEDLSFHLALVRLAGNPAMEHVLLGIEQLMVETQMMPLYSLDRLLEPIAEHEAIIDVISRRDPELANVMMRYHIAKAAERTGAVFLAG